MSEPGKNGHDALVENWLREYGNTVSHMESAAQAIRQAVVARLNDDGLNYHAVESRVKGIQSLGDKLRRRRADGTIKYPEGPDLIDDAIGLRIITYLSGDVEKAITSLKGSFCELSHEDKTAEQKARGEFGYSGQHLVLQVALDKQPAGCQKFANQRFEVQFRTILEHAWAEFEHDIRYKGPQPASPEVNRAFTLASGLIELANKEFTTISEVVAAQQSATPPADIESSEDGDALDSKVLQVLLEHALPTHPRSKAEQYEWLCELLAANAVTSREEATKLIQDADWHFIDKKIQYKFPAGHVRAADDLLLDHWGEGYIERTSDVGEDDGRRGKLTYRLQKLRS